MEQTGNISDYHWLVTVETQRVKRYLFASPYLRETRGASLLLDQLNRVASVGLLPTDSTRYITIYFGGGNAKVLFRNEAEAKGYRGRLTELYAKAAPGASVAIECTRRSSGEDVADWIRSGVYATGQVKRQAGSSESRLLGRWARPCTSCGKAPATVGWREFELHYLCVRCVCKRRAVKHHYTDTRPGIDRQRRLPPPEQLTNVYSELSIFTDLAKTFDSASNTLLLPQDFNEIGEQAAPSGYIGFIYADGNAMGEVAKRIGTVCKRAPNPDAAAIATFAAFSRIADAATRKATIDALRTYFDTSPIGGIKTLPFEVLLAGGDDLMLAVPAQYALPVAHHFVTTFGEESARLHDAAQRTDHVQPFAPAGLSTSVGVVLAHCSYPATDLVDFASDLLLSAKRVDAPQPSDPDQPPPGAIDFMVLHDAASDSPSERRQRDYIISGGEQPIYRTERPYEAWQLSKLLERIWRFRQHAPRSKMRALYDSLFAESHWQTRYQAERIRERLKTTGALAACDELRQLVQHELNVFPFRSRADNGITSFSTPLSEIVELWDFVTFDPGAQPAGGSSNGTTQRHD